GNSTNIINFTHIDLPTFDRQINTSFLDMTDIDLFINVTGDSQFITDYGFVLSSALNLTYLQKGENETLVYLSSSEANLTYLLIGENLSTSMDLSYLLESNNTRNINGTHIALSTITTDNLDLSNITLSSFTNDTNFITSNEIVDFLTSTQLNDSYTLNSSLSNYDLFNYNQTTPAIDFVTLSYITSTQLNNSYLLIGENITSSSVLDLSAYLTGNKTNVVNLTHLNLATLDTTFPLLNNTNTFTNNNTFSDTTNLTRKNLQAVHVWKNADQTLTSGVETLITWSSTTFDPLNIFDNANDRITPNIAGKWRFKVSFRISSNSNRFFRIRKNGSSSSHLYEDSTTSQSMGDSIIFDMNGVTDYVDVTAQHSTGSDQPVTGEDGRTYFEAEYLGT
ncbi:MAG: hypothetical protein AABY22_03630, partial [Nanoarchaeota archaeon]